MSWDSHRNDRERRDRAAQDRRVAEESRLASEYQRQVPGMSRSEALRIAAKHVAADSPRLV